MARVFIFSAATFLGTFAASLFPPTESTSCRFITSTEPYPQIYVEELAKIEAVRSPPGIQIYYDGWDHDILTKEVYLTMVIYNGHSVPAVYSGFSATHAFPLIRGNGSRAIDLGECQIGAEQFKIEPGHAAEVHVKADDFTRRPDPDEQISISFSVHPEGTVGGGSYSSYSFYVPEKFARTIKPIRIGF